MAIFFRSNCYNGGNKHCFEPRYSEEEIQQKNVKIPLFFSAPHEARKLLVKEVYIKDICKWCGKSINKEE